MSVLACDRKGCDNVICDTFWAWCQRYICDDCLKELKEYRETWPDDMPTRYVASCITQFFDTPPGTYVLVNKLSNHREVDEEFGRLTKNDF